MKKNQPALVNSKNNYNCILGITITVILSYISKKLTWGRRGKVVLICWEDILELSFPITIFTYTIGGPSATIEK